MHDVRTDTASHEKTKSECCTELHESFAVHAGAAVSADAPAAVGQMPDGSDAKDQSVRDGPYARFETLTEMHDPEEH